ncbi:C4-dicarboxylate ABC transporter [Mycobacterium sp. 1423905.2]|nr:tellurite resistance/C4-dicarboxylate transporter family protein [Mycobacterium sp. 1423905.2]OBJ50358.1 C4-dicarboxylate ABC transporter [Mycobacterium sp. 1423905.2]
MNLRLADVEPAPDVFAAVMATGIVSIAAHLQHYRWISDTLGVLATAGLLVLVMLVAVYAVLGRIRWDLTDPDVTLRLFTFVAACAVLDSRLAAQPVVVATLGGVALSAWLALTALTVRNMCVHRGPVLRARAHGAWELASVGTSGLAIVATQVARHTPRHWPLAFAVPVWVAALCIYALMTWLILWRAVTELHQHNGFEPDSWILMGGLAIATLAGESIHNLASGWLAPTLRLATVVTWVAASLWIPVLIYFGVRRTDQRMLRFAGVWWAMVFPLGMYSAATDAMAAELGQRSLGTVSLVFFWIAFSAWVVVAGAGLLRLVSKPAA